MIALLDVNLLLALAWPNHMHHAAARRWFSGHRDDGWATCPVTQSGFIRVSSNRRVYPVAKSPVEAIALLEQIVAVSGHHFFSDDVDFTCNPSIDRKRLLGHRQVTDIHLLAIAKDNGAYLATFDQGVKELLPQRDRGSVLTVPV